MDAANVDLKAFSERFYRKICGAELGAVLETLEYLKHETRVWLEITTLLIPGENDSDAELHALTQWVVEKLGTDVPLHFTAFHPDWKMMDKSPTPPATLTRAREIALGNGARYAYTGNVRDSSGSTTFCHGCREPVIERNRYAITGWRLDGQGRCNSCQTQLPGVFSGAPGHWGNNRVSLRMS
jgi:pyruvate formate lyase activating enzyme